MNRIALAYSSNFLCSRLLKNLLVQCVKKRLDFDSKVFNKTLMTSTKKLTLNNVVQRNGVSV